LLVIVDANKYQAMGATDEVMKLGAIVDKFQAFGFETLQVDGHDELAIDKAIIKLMAIPSEQPRALIADTIKGKGVSFMEGDNLWHYTRLTAETYARAIAELEDQELHMLVK
jgi:transketolase